MAGDEEIGRAKVAADEAARAYFRDVLGGRDGDCCGFAWVDVAVRANAKNGDAKRCALRNAGAFEAGNRWRLFVRVPADVRTQSLSCVEAAASAFADTLRRQGWNAEAHSRMD